MEAIHENRELTPFHPIWSSWPIDHSKATKAWKESLHGKARNDSFTCRCDVTKGSVENHFVGIEAQKEMEASCNGIHEGYAKRNRCVDSGRCGSNRRKWSSGWGYWMHNRCVDIIFPIFILWLRWKAKTRHKLLEMGSESSGQRSWSGAGGKAGAREVYCQ